MSHRFTFSVDPAGTEIRLMGPEGALPVRRWALDASADLVPGIDLAQRLDAAGSAIMDGDVLLIEHEATARLSGREGAVLGLPPPAQVVAHVETGGLITSPSFRVECRLKRPNGQSLLGAERTGAWLRVGGAWERLPEPLFAISTAVDAFAAASHDDYADRMVALSALRDALPTASALGLAETSGLIGRMTIAVADAFSLDLAGAADARLSPILHRSGGVGDEPLLPSDQQRAFAEQRFHASSHVPPVYPLGAGWYVVLQPQLRRALAEVRRVNSGSPAARRALMANPRAFLRETLGDDVDDVVLEGLFRETDAYSERVIGLGLWRPRVVPWIPVGGTDWFGGAPPEAPGSFAVPESRRGLRIGDRVIELDEVLALALMADVEAAMRAGRSDVPFVRGSDSVRVPASHETLGALEALGKGAASTAAAVPPSGSERLALLIKTHEDSVDASAEGIYAAKRPAPPAMVPEGMRTILKQHQSQGLRWLQAAWTAGAPGVLLADDMGLGKTLQGLAFLAWLREGMRRGTVERLPLLVVAPAGLLDNWKAEHGRHLGGDGLGEVLEAFGRGLAALRLRSSDGTPGLRRDPLAMADWVLTTYETLRDYDRDFGLVRFAAILFDEAQKVKTPGVRLTDAAKAMKAEFRIALTGTPVENRLADLWCISDAVHPAILGDLKTFSATYERDPEPDSLRTLKMTLERPFGGRPPFMLRRLRADQLPDLPPATEVVTRHAMPDVQQAAYDRVLAEARGARRSGAILEVLQRLRSISLHPHHDMVGSDADFIAASGRLQGLFETLDRIAEAREAVLIFLDDLNFQSRLAGIVQRRYGLGHAPMLINGGVAGRHRQERVDAFQKGETDFDAMILSPRAGGVGLTLTRASHVVHLARWWNPAIEDQCNGRVHRLGQKRPVSFHVPIATSRGEKASFDENLASLMARKRRLMRDTLMPSDGNSDAERQELFEATVL